MHSCTWFANLTNPRDDVMWKYSVVPCLCCNFLLPLPASAWVMLICCLSVFFFLIFFPYYHENAPMFLRRRGEAPRPTPFTTPRRLWRTPRRRHTHIVRRCKLEFYILMQHIHISFVANSWAHVPFFPFQKLFSYVASNPLKENCMTIKEFSNQTHYQLLRIK